MCWSNRNSLATFSSPWIVLPIDPIISPLRYHFFNWSIDKVGPTIVYFYIPKMQNLSWTYFWTENQVELGTKTTPYSILQNTCQCHTGLVMLTHAPSSCRRTLIIQLRSILCFRFLGQHYSFGAYSPHESYVILFNYYSSIIYLFMDLKGVTILSKKTIPT